MTGTVFGPRYLASLVCGQPYHGRASDRRRASISTNGKPQRVRRRSYVLRIALPTLVAMGLFLAALGADPALL